ncbi:hypothetical protein [Ruegeria intermedia]|uniref:hypothetical protein n=1 Tax=Ruegeria intermedia TaxID=996115 RepID=UPI001CB6C213|nr:hypothetical protein [Ruegeria intermedia]
MTVVERYGASPRPKWLCRCACGNLTVKDGSRLRQGNVKSCGCATRAMISAARRTHGMTGHRLDNIRRGMIARCHNPRSKDYKRYGARGIRVCQEWRDTPASFYDWARANGYAHDLSIDRIDASGGYNPDNCRWIPLSENVARARRAKRQNAA